MKSFLWALLPLFSMACSSPALFDDPKEGEEPLSLQSVLGGQSTEGFDRADKPRQFVFPDDHGPHPSFRSEWWYITGNLESPQGPFGFEFTIFRQATAPDAPGPDESGWRTNQIYMAHAALSDIGANRFYADERFARGTLGLAGAEANPMNVWLENWRLEAEVPSLSAFTLSVEAEDFNLQLVLKPQKPMVLQGDAGLSQKGHDVGNASYYYSFTNIAATGQLSRGKKPPVEVGGQAWMDREWSSSVLEENQIGWDWFALSFKDGREIMLYQLREKDGAASPFSAGTLVAQDGRSTKIPRSDFSIEVLNRWTNPATQTTYPAQWRLSINELPHPLLVTPRMANQELPFGLPYWEGSVDIQNADTKEHLGLGYVELTGYAK